MAGPRPVGSSPAFPGRPSTATSATSRVPPTWTSRVTPRPPSRPRPSVEATRAGSTTSPPSTASRSPCAGSPPYDAAGPRRASPTSTRRCSRCWPATSTRCGRATSTARSIHLCDELGDLARMRAWTASMARWSQPQGRTFMFASVTGSTSSSSWPPRGTGQAVEEELGDRSADLVGAHGWLAGEGYYTLAEVRRLRGDAEGAADGVRTARGLNHDALPGAALLLQAEGRPDDALAALRVGLADATRLGRARMLLDAARLALARGRDGVRHHADGRARGDGAAGSAPRASPPGPPRRGPRCCSPRGARARRSPCSSGPPRSTASSGTATPCRCPRVPRRRPPRRGRPRPRRRRRPRRPWRSTPAWARPPTSRGSSRVGNGRAG